MSKDLEREYRELISEDVPDLWDRIEDRLEQKQPETKRNSMRKNYRVWGAAAAACVCLAVAVPVLLRSGPESYGDSPSYSGAAAPEDNAGEMHFAAADEAAGSETAMWGSEGSSYGEYSAYKPKVLASVTQVVREEGRAAYTVRLEETLDEEFSEGDTVNLYADDIIEGLTEGESYLFELWAFVDDEDVTEYWILDVQ